MNVGLWTAGYRRGRLLRGLLWCVGFFVLFVMIIVLSSIFVLVFCMELANRIELGFQIEGAEVGGGTACVRGSHTSQPGT